MPFIEDWQQQITESLASLVHHAPQVKDIDLITGVLPVGVLWPIRQPVREYDGPTADAVREIVGSEAGRILKIVSGWSDDQVAAARALAAKAANDAKLRTALTCLVDRFDAIQIFAEQLSKLYTPHITGNTFNITEQIKAALVNIGGVTNIDRLSVELNLPPPTQVIPTTQRRLWYVAGLILLTSAVLIIYQVVYPLIVSPTKPRMTGDFNVAVAEFGRLDTQNRVVKDAIAADLSNSVYTDMANQLRQFTMAGAVPGDDFQIEVLGPTETGWIPGTTRQERAIAAAKLASDMNADVIVYGHLKFDATTSSFVPEFYLSDRRLEDAKELVGQYELGSSINSSADIANNIVARNKLRTQLRSRTGSLGQFVIGMSYYVTNNFEQAQQYFEQAKNANGWDDGDGKEVLYLFLGNTAGKQNDLTAAKGYYDRALELEPEYARARLGVAEVIFHQSKGSCEQNASKGSLTSDQAGIEDAIRIYRSALDAQIQPALADIKAKMDFGLGRAYLCLSQAQIGDHWDAATQSFSNVIAEYESGNQRLQDMAAEAYAGRGFISLPYVDDPNATKKFRDAIPQYKKAIELSRHPDRQAAFHDMLGYIHRRLKEYDEADKAYTDAIRLDPQNREQYEQKRQELQRERELEPSPQQ